MLIHALQTGEGIFQFVSPRAHKHTVSPAQTNVRRKNPSILDELIQRMSFEDDNINLRLGDRFALTKVTPILSESGNDDHVQYLIEAEDLPGTTSPRRKYSTVLTQVGLPFKNAVLTSNAIVRASLLLDAHKAKTVNLPSDQKSPSNGASQLIVSHAGIGRNATLIVYRDIRSEIDAGMVDRANLDKTLYRIVAAHRAVRGPHFIHSEPQLAALREALWLHCLATPKPKPSCGDRARRLFSVRRSASSPAVDLEGLTDTPASPANSIRRGVTLVRSRSMSSMSSMLAGWPGRPVAPEYVGVATSPSSGTDHAQAIGTSALPNRFHQEIDHVGNCRFHDADKVNGHYSNFWQGQAVVIGGEEYKTVEHYFQAQKFAPRKGVPQYAARIREQIMAAATADEAKKLARNNLRFAVSMQDWIKKLRVGEMYQGVHAKFSQDEDLKAILLATENAQLIETMPGPRNDTFWGVRGTTGANMLGRILMQVREDLRENRRPDPNACFEPDDQQQW